MDPITGTLLATLGTSLLKDLFSSSSAPSGPSQAQILAMLQAQQAQQAAAQERMWLIGGGIAVFGLLAFMISRK